MTRTRTPSGTTRAGWAVLAATALALTAVGTSSAAAPGPATRPVAAVPVAQPPKAECTETYNPSTSTSGAGVQGIKRRGRLIVGTSGDVILWGARNPDTARLEGFDIELARELAKAILGNPNAVEFRVINYAQRIPALQNDSVDLVLHTMTINCERWEQVNFSSVYYDAGQKLLVRNESDAPASMAAFEQAGLKVCVAKGSTNLENLAANYPKVARLEVDDLGECLVRFQQGVVDGITGDDTVLAGFAVQDPYAKVVGDALTAEPYGIGVKKEKVDLVRYVNAVLDDLRENGRWTAIYRSTMGTALEGQPVPAPPRPTYGRTG